MPASQPRTGPCLLGNFRGLLPASQERTAHDSHAAASCLLRSDALGDAQLSCGGILPASQRCAPSLMSGPLRLPACVAVMARTSYVSCGGLLPASQRRTRRRSANYGGRGRKQICHLASLPQTTTTLVVAGISATECVSMEQVLRMCIVFPQFHYDVFSGSRLKQELCDLRQGWAEVRAIFALHS